MVIVMVAQNHENKWQHLFLEMESGDIPGKTCNMPIDTFCSGVKLPVINL